MRCTPLAGDRTQVVWHEWFHLPGGPGRPGGLAGALAGLEAQPDPALRRFARLVEAGPPALTPLAASRPVVGWPYAWTP